MNENLNQVQTKSFGVARSRGLALKVASGVALAVVAGSASAAPTELPAPITTMIADILLYVGFAFAAAVPVFAAIRSSSAIMGLVSKFLGKAGA